MTHPTPPASASTRISEPGRGEHADGLPAPQRYWSVAAIALAIAMAVLDSAIANVALPTIARDFGVAPADAIWIVNAYQIAIVVTLLPAASLGEILGYWRVYLLGLALFTIGSLACALSGNLVGLTLARLLQGVGASGIMAINGALLRFTYPQRSIGRGVGFNALVVSVSSVIGPTVASAILALGTWQWLFAINLPVGLLALLIAALALPRPPRVPRRFDVVSALLNAAAFGFVIVGIDVLTRSARHGIGAAMLAAGAVSAVWLTRRELRTAVPLLPLDLMRSRLFAFSVATSICSFCAQMLAFVPLPFLFEGAMGRSAVDTGILLTPWPIAVGIVAPIAGRMSDRFPAAILGGCGLLVLAGGLLALFLMPHDAGTVDIAWRMAVCGLGFGFFQAPNNRTMLLSAPRHRAGAAGGMLATARLTGQTAGATTVAILFALIPAQGATLSLAVAAALAFLGAGASFARLSADPPQA